LYEANQSETTIRTVIELPPGYRHLVIAPQSATYAAPDRLGRVQISTTEGEGKFTITQFFATSLAVVSPENFPALQETRIHPRKQGGVVLSAGTRRQTVRAVSDAATGDQYGRSNRTSKRTGRIRVVLDAATGQQRSCTGHAAKSREHQQATHRRLYQRSLIFRL